MADGSKSSPSAAIGDAEKRPGAVSRIVAALGLLLRQRDFRVVVVCATVMGLAVSFVVPFMSMFGTLEVGMSLGLFGAFMTTNAVVNVVISTVLANRSDTRYSRRTMLLVGSGAGALGYLGYAFARAPPTTSARRS